MTVIVTGAAGFIGFHVAQALLARGERVVGIDNLNDYYDVSLKEARLALLQKNPNFSFAKADISDRDAIFAVIDDNSDTTGIVHLAAQAGVRYSRENPYVYIQANVMGQVVMLEAARRLKGLKHFVYASSSSVYGANTEMPFSIDQRVEKPISLYAATKRADELISYTYAHLYGIPQTGLRFFTVYGPWGRPDMAPMLFASAISKGEPIRVFNNGEMARDFTYIDDIVDGVLRALDRPATGEPPHVVYNLGNQRSERLMDFIAAIEGAMGSKAEINFEPMQPGDVPVTYADIDATQAALGYEPRTPISEGVPKFVAWYKSHYGA
ncbi:SDR family NAD(P)-dependent oxidoreductase [Terricaulis silvestris]|uniref:UDP-glucose 4-epimerase n=1 Tax=Terricaulis silvestris TaxID=2686094 RepID=A0A6I6MH07_9CAUL|nr:SDR family NAD(P)-dependent oxidoreductase [Terricaulis silvestris]QGZ94065.1 UDP-glucose 4-epimerase [Terricaulis silvestris]